MPVKVGPEKNCWLASESTSGSPSRRPLGLRSPKVRIDASELAARWGGGQRKVGTTTGPTYGAASAPCTTARPPPRFTYGTPPAAGSVLAAKLAVRGDSALPCAGAGVGAARKRPACPPAAAGCDARQPGRVRGHPNPEQGALRRSLMSSKGRNGDSRPSVELTRPVFLPPPRRSHRSRRTPPDAGSRPDSCGGRASRCLLPCGSSTPCRRGAGPMAERLPPPPPSSRSWRSRMHGPRHGPNCPRLTPFIACLLGRTAARPRPISGRTGSYRALSSS